MSPLVWSGDTQCPRWHICGAVSPWSDVFRSLGTMWGLIGNRAEKIRSFGFGSPEHPQCAAPSPAPPFIGRGRIISGQNDKSHKRKKKKKPKPQQISDNKSKFGDDYRARRSLLKCDWTADRRRDFVSGVWKCAAFSRRVQRGPVTPIRARNGDDIHWG